MEWYILLCTISVIELRLMSKDSHLLGRWEFFKTYFNWSHTSDLALSHPTHVQCKFITPLVSVTVCGNCHICYRYSLNENVLQTFYRIKMLIFCYSIPDLYYSNLSDNKSVVSTLIIIVYEYNVTIYLCKDYAILKDRLFICVKITWYRRIGNLRPISCLFFVVDYVTFSQVSCS